MGVCSGPDRFLSGTVAGISFSASRLAKLTISPSPFSLRGRLHRSLLFLVPLWPAVGAAVLAITRMCGGRSGGRFVAVASVLLSLGSLAGSVWWGGGLADRSVVDVNLISPRMAPNALRVRLGLDEIALSWVLSSSIAVLAMMLRGSSEAEGDGGDAENWNWSAARETPLGILSCLQFAGLSRDFGLLTVSIVTLVVLTAGLVRDASRPARLQLRFAWGVAVVLLVSGAGWLWTAFQTLGFEGLAAGIAGVTDREAAQATAQLIATLLSAAALVLCGVVPLCGWMRGIAASRNGEFVFIGPVSVGLLLLLRARFWLQFAQGDGQTLLGAAAITALLVGFVALTAATRREAAVCAAVAWTMMAAAGAALGTEATAWSAILLAAALQCGIPLLMQPGPWGYGSLLVLVAFAAEFTGQQRSLPFVPAALSLEPAAVVLFALNGLAHFAVCFGLFRSLFDGFQIQARLADQRERDATDPVARTSSVFLLAGVLLACYGQQPPRLSWEGAGLANHFLRGLLGNVFTFCNIPALLAARALYGRPSSWPERLARGFSSLHRLSRRGLYLDEVALAAERSAGRAADLWRAADMPLVLQPDQEPGSRDQETNGAALSPAAPGLQSVAAVLLTAIAVWLAMTLT